MRESFRQVPSVEYRSSTLPASVKKDNVNLVLIQGQVLIKDVGRNRAGIQNSQKMEN
jgi:hypothetical protein